MEEEVLKMENWGLIKENWGCMMENWGLRIQKWGWRVVDWGYTNKIWGVDHATPIFNTNNFGLPLSRITLFWGYFETLNLPLEDILQLFPGLIETPLINSWDTLDTLLRHPSNIWLQLLWMLQTNQIDYTLTHTQTQLVTSSLLELLIAAKNKLIIKLSNNLGLSLVKLSTYGAEFG